MKNNIFIIVIIGVFTGMLLFAGCSCEEQKKTSKQAKIIETPRPSQTAQDPVSRAHDAMGKNNLDQAIKISRSAFDDAFKTKPKDPTTWEFWLKICEGYAKKEENDLAKQCYDRLFSETKDINMSPHTMSSAARWRTIIALQTNNGPDAQFYYTKQAKYESELRKIGELPPKLEAYSAFIRSGVLRLQNDFDKAIASLQKAIKLYHQSGETNPAPLDSYQEKLGMMAVEAKMFSLALDTYREMEVNREKEFGMHHPMVAVARMYQIRTYLAMGDKEKGRSEWDFVANIMKRVRKEQLPKHIDNLYVETMIMLDMEGMLGSQNVKP